MYFIVYSFIIILSVGGRDVKGDGDLGLDFEPASCRLRFSRQFGETMAVSRCAPRAALVYVPQTSADILNLPNRVSVMRCDGHCSELGSCCVASAVRVETIAIQRRNITSGEEECGTVLMEEHVDCDCTAGSCD